MCPRAGEPVGCVGGRAPSGGAGLGGGSGGAGWPAVAVTAHIHHVQGEMKVAASAGSAPLAVCSPFLLLLLLSSWASLSVCAPRRTTAPRRNSCSQRKTATLTRRGQTQRSRSAPCCLAEESVWRWYWFQQGFVLFCLCRKRSWAQVRRSPRSSTNMIWSRFNLTLLFRESQLWS